MTAHINGTDIYYEIHGEGRPLILLHGNGEDHRIFDEAVDILSANFACCTPDSRGHGSSAAADRLSYTDMAEDMTALMEHLDMRDAVFCGFSDGGIVGLLAAQSERISELVVCGANLDPSGVKLHWRRVFEREWRQTRNELTGLMRREPHISYGRLHRIKARTLVAAGSRDLIREEQTRRIARMIPGAKLKILAGETHGSYVVHSRRIADIIMEFTGRS